MDLEGILLSERSQTEKDKRSMISLTYGNSNKSRPVEEEIRLAVSRGEGWGKGELNEGGRKAQTASYKRNEP